MPVKKSGILSNKNTQTDRSCLDNIYTVTSSTRYILIMKKDTFACFIDTQTAFNCVDKDQLFYKLI